MKPLQVGIIEDEFLARETLQAFLERHCEGVEVVFQKGDLESGVEAIQLLKPDAIFLDIEMPGQSGMEIKEALGNEKAPLIVFTTAYANYAVDAFGLEAVDYLLKPIDIVKLRRALSRISERMQGQALKPLEKLAVPSSNGQRYIDPTDIEYLMADGSYTEIYLQNNEKVLVSKKLKDLEEQLLSTTFMRVHRSYLINLTQVEALIRETNTRLRMKSGAIIPVARNSKEALKEALNT
jgi:two-component system LytT family response regulator